MIDTSRYQHSPSCFVYQNVTLNYGSGVTKAIYDSFVWNDNGCFNFGNNRWVASKAGRVMLSAGINVDFTSSTSELNYFTLDTVLLRADNTVKASARLYQNNESSRTFYQVTGTTLYEVDVGDQIETTFQTGHSLMNRNSVGRSCYLSVFYLI